MTINTMHSNVFLSLGSNVGDRHDYIVRALASLWKEEVKLVKKSSFYETEPVGVKNQPWFLNICVEVRLCYLPRELLRVIHSVEHMFGRERKEPWGPRAIDIDILFFGDEIISEAHLVIPHPRLAERKFILIPLVEIAPYFIHPISHYTVFELLSRCGDMSIVKKIEGYNNRLS